MATRPEAVAEIVKAHGYYDTPNGSACAIVRELAKQIDADVATAASMRKKGWQGLGKAWDLISPRIAEYADALANAKPPVPADAPCPAVQSGTDAPCVRTGPHEAHTYAVPGLIDKPGGPVEQYDNSSDPQAHPDGDPIPPACGLSDEFGGATPDACLLDRAHIDRGENHQGKFSRWPVRGEDVARWLAANAPGRLHPEAVMAFISGATDELTLPEPAPVTGELVAVGASGEVPTFNLAPLPRAPLPDEEIPAALPPMEDAMQPDPFANAGIVPDSEIRRTATWRPAPDPRPLWLPREAAPLIPNSIRVTHVRVGEACGMQYRLVSRDEVPEVPAWWNAGGTALHACAQRFEDMWASGNYDLDHLAHLSDESAREWWAYEFAVAIAATEAETPFPRHQWRAAAKGTEGYEWWMANGPEMVRSYAAASAEWHREGWSILQMPAQTANGTPMSEPAMELEMRYGLPGGGELVGHLDQAWVRVTAVGDGEVIEIRVRDLKSGGSVTDDPWQPEAYTMLLRTHLYAAGWPIERINATTFSAVYYDARNGKDKEPWTVDVGSDAFGAIAYRASSVYRMHEANLYPANPGSDWKAPCYLCPVRYACPIMATKE